MTRFLDPRRRRHLVTLSIPFIIVYKKYYFNPRVGLLFRKRQLEERIDS
jgi:hypothetical protein